MKTDKRTQLLKILSDASQSNTFEEFCAQMR